MDTVFVPQDYENLLKEYRSSRKELDELYQELYNCRRQLNVAEALQREYACEIEVLQENQNKELKKLKETNVHLEESLNSVHGTYSTKINNLEAELLKKDEKIRLLQIEVEDLKNIEAERPDDTSTIINEIVELKNENEQLLLNSYDLSDTLKTVEKDKLNLEEKLNQCTEENVFLKEVLNGNRQELQEHKNLIEKLNDDVFGLNSELEMLKNKPLDENTKGNSLFAEVNDRRVYLQETINKMKADYIQMKQERAKHLKEISHLKKENITLCEKWKNDIQEIGEDKCLVINALKNNIKTLEAIVNEHKKDDNVSGQSEYEVFQELLNLKSKEIEELNRQLMCKASTEVQLTHALTAINRKLRYWRAEALMVRQQFDDCDRRKEEINPTDGEITETEELGDIGGWKQSLKGPKLPDKEMKTEEIKRIQQIQGILKKNKDVADLHRKQSISKEQEKNDDISEGNKENIESANNIAENNVDEKLTKKVSFFGNENEFKTTGHVTTRRKKVILSKPIYFVSSETGTVKSLPSTEACDKSK